MLTSNVCCRIASGSPRAGADRQGCSIQPYSSHQLAQVLLPKDVASDEIHRLVEAGRTISHRELRSDSC
jgi:hypothetical protein